MNFLSVFLIAAKRLWNNKGLTLCSIIGLIDGCGSDQQHPAVHRCGEL